MVDEKNEELTSRTFFSRAEKKKRRKIFNYRFGIRPRISHNGERECSVSDR